MATSLPDSLKRAYTDMQMLALQTTHLNERLREGIQRYHESSGAVNDLVAQHQKMLTVGDKIMSQWQKSRTLSAQSFDEYRKLAAGVQGLTKQYKEFAIIQKALEILTKTTWEKFTGLAGSLSKLSSSATGLAARFGGLALGYKELTDRLLTYNRTVFDGMRIGQRYGDTLEEFDATLKNIQKTTAFSKQDFAELNLVFKQMTVGIPMTSAAVGKFAETLSGKFGWSAEKVISVTKELLNIQTKLPSLISRVNQTIDAFSQSADAGAESADALYNKLLAIGTSQSDIETVMSAVSKVKPDLNAWMGFEKTMATSKRDIADANLLIADNMKGALESVAKIQAGIAKSLTLLPPAVMMGVGAFSMMGAALTGILIQLGNAVSLSRVLWQTSTKMGGAAWMGMTGGSGAPGSPGAPGLNKSPMGRVGVGMGAAMGGLALSMGAGMADDAMTENWLKKNQGEESSGTSIKGKKSGMGALKGAGIAAAYSAPLAMIPGIGIALVGIAAGVGGIVGGIKGWKEGKNLESQQAAKRNEISTEKAARMGSIAKSSGIKIGAGDTQSDIIEKLRLETDLSKQQVAVETLYAQGLLRRDQLQQIFIGGKNTEVQTAEKIDDIITKTFGHEKKRFEMNMQIKRAAAGQLEALERTLEIVMKLKEAGEGMAEALKSGNIGSGLAKTLAEVGVQGAQATQQTLSRKLSAQFIRANSDDKQVRDALSPDKNIALDKIKKATEDEKELARQRAKIFEESQVNAKKAPDDKSKQEILANAQTQMDALDNQSKDISKSIDDLMKSFDWENAIPPSKVFEELERMQQELSKATDPKEIERLQDKMSQFADTAGKVQAAAGAVMDAQVNASTQNIKREIALKEQQIELGETQLSLAEKMGMPQSYRALQNQVNLTYGLYQSLEKQKQSQADVIAGWEKEREIKIDTESVMNRTKTVEDAVAEAADRAHLTTAERATEEQKLIKALTMQTDISNKQLQTEAKLAELTKTWREGWMDAMEESVANAGDFAAVIGLGDKNIPEKIAAGAPDTFKYGGTNRRALEEYTAQQVRYGQSARFTDVYGNISGEMKNPNALMRESNALAWNPQSSEALRQAVLEAVKSAVIPVAVNSPAGLAGMDSKLEAVANGAAPSGTWKPTPAQTIQPGEYAATDIRNGQPGNPSVGRLVPQVVNPLNDSATNLNRAADALTSAAAALGSDKTNGGSTGISKSSGGSVTRFSGGGMIPRFLTGGGLTAEELAKRAAATRVKDALTRTKASRGMPTGMSSTSTSAIKSADDLSVSARLAKATSTDEIKMLKGITKANPKNLPVLSKASKNIMKNAIRPPKSLSTAAVVAQIAAPLIVPEFNTTLLGEMLNGTSSMGEDIVTADQYGGDQTKDWQKTAAGLATSALWYVPGGALAGSGYGAAKYGMRKYAEYDEKNTAQKQSAQEQRQLDALRGGGLRERLAKKYPGTKIPNVLPEIPLSYEDMDNQTRARTKAKAEVAASSEKVQLFTNKLKISPERHKSVQQRLSSELASAIAEGDTDPSEMLRQSGLDIDLAIAQYNPKQTAYETVMEKNQAFNEKWNRPTSIQERNAILASGDKWVGNRLEGQFGSNRLEGQFGSNRLEGQFGSNRLEGKFGSNRLEGRRTTRMASGGQLEGGSFVINQAASSANAGLLNSMGAGWVTGGTPGKDSVMFDVMANGGSPSESRALLMPGEAVLPPEFASIGDAINRGMPAFENGGVVNDVRAARDIATSNMPRGGGGGGSSSGGGVTVELTPEVAELLRFQGKSDYSNGSAP